MQPDCYITSNFVLQCYHTLIWNVKPYGAQARSSQFKLTWELSKIQQIFMCLYFTVPNNDSWNTLNNKQQKVKPWSHIKASCWAVYLCMKKQVVFLPPCRTTHRHVLQESLQMRRVTGKPQASVKGWRDWPVTEQRELGVISGLTGSSLTGWGRVFASGSDSDCECEFGRAEELLAGATGQTSTTDCSTHRMTPRFGHLKLKLYYKR